MDLQSGPFSYENWKAQINGVPSYEAYEYPLYTDARIVGEITSGFGPYQFLNTVLFTTTPILAPAIVLRAEYAVAYDYGAGLPEKTDVDLYHGGLLNDEMASLLALCLGIRLKSGGYTRHFRHGGDPRGNPTAFETSRNPILPLHVGSSVIAPRLLGERSLDQAEPLKNFPLLGSDSAIALVKAARQYQDGVWIIESQPELAWLMLVSSLETAAFYWRSSKEAPVERLRASQPKLEKLLNDECGQALLEKVADLIAPYMGATKKFVDFVLEFLPDPPQERPKAFQLAWDRQNIKETLEIIYDWRSKALHGGTPFPMPMCMPPLRVGGSFAEIPTGLAAKSRGGVWLAKDTPVNLHSFEYITRNVLLKWWSSLSKSR